MEGVLAPSRCETALMSDPDELQALASRLRAAADSERRGLERDLHDGVQQDLSALDVNLQFVQALVDSDLAAAKVLLEEMREHVQQTLARVRALAAEIYPSILPLRGLTEALRALPAQVEATASGRYLLVVEEAVYFCCAELLRHAGPAAALHVSQEGDILSLTIAGADLDDASLALVRDRLAALGGTLTVSGTAARGEIPL
jgi:signal transduction histidine kinase